MVMVQKIRGDQGTFAEVVDSMMSMMVLHKEAVSQSVHILEWSSTFTDIIQSRTPREREERLRKQPWIQKHQGRPQDISMIEIPNT